MHYADAISRPVYIIRCICWGLGLSLELLPANIDTEPRFEVREFGLGSVERAPKGRFSLGIL